jgi:hypothetical protein
MTGTLDFPELLLIPIVIVAAAAMVVPACRICAKAGYSSWLGLLAIVPIANLCLVYFVAFTKWPIESELARSRPESTSDR